MYPGLISTKAGRSFFRKPYQRDVDVNCSVREKLVHNRSFRRHHVGIFLGALNPLLLLRKRRAWVSGRLSPQPSRMRRRIELGRLLQHQRFLRSRGS